jgi:hypothetical protein
MGMEKKEWEDRLVYRLCTLWPFALIQESLGSGPLSQMFYFHLRWTFNWDRGFLFFPFLQMDFDPALQSVLIPSVLRCPPTVLSSSRKSRCRVLKDPWKESAQWFWPTLKSSCEFINLSYTLILDLIHLISFEQWRKTTRPSVLA